MVHKLLSRSRGGLQPLSAGQRPGLSKRERRILAACAEVLLPAGGAIPISGMEAGVVDYFEGMMGRVPLATRVLLRAMLQLVEFSPMFYGPLKGPISSLAERDRSRVLRGLMNSRVYVLRTAFLGLRTVLTIAYFGNPEVSRSIGATPNLNPFQLQGAAA
ncbi:MAG: hypothetical protein MUF54_07490 [Polyangiaceae bacterium]|jgi:hypothetical protein|nr:hypothetical protein [Polyangiaceae bacterium]